MATVLEYDINKIEKKKKKKNPFSRTQKAKRRRRKEESKKSYDEKRNPLFVFNQKTFIDIARSEELIKEKFDFSKMEEKAGELILQQDKKGCVRYSPEDRSAIILDYLNMFRDGYSALEATNKFKEKHKCSGRVASKWREEALAMLEKYTVKDIEKARSQQVLRLEGLLQKAIDRDDLKTAQQICDTINKLYGLYQQQQTTVVAPVIKFDFGTASTTVIPQPEVIDANTFPVVENNDSFFDEVDSYKF